MEALLVRVGARARVTAEGTDDTRRFFAEACSSYRSFGLTIAWP